MRLIVVVCGLPSGTTSFAFLFPPALEVLFPSLKGSYSRNCILNFLLGESVDEPGWEAVPFLRPAWPSLGRPLVSSVSVVLDPREAE